MSDLFGFELGDDCSAKVVASLPKRAGKADRDVPSAPGRIRGYVVESENFESIHNHSAYALIEKDKDLDETAA